MIAEGKAFTESSVKRLGGRGRSFAGPAALCLLFFLTLGASPAVEAYSVLDIQDGSALPGGFGILNIYLSQAKGLDTIDFTVTFDPQIMQNVVLVRGDATENFENWTTERNTDWIRASGSTSRVPIIVEDAMVARVLFTVASTAQQGQSVNLILDDAYGSQGYEIRSDTGTFTVGGPVEETGRELELEVVPDRAMPGDQVEIRMWLNHTPKLSHFQVFLDYPDGALFPNGEVGGTLVESLGWEGYYTPPRPGVDPSTLITVFGATAPQPAPKGRFLAARVPFEVGRTWGGSWRFDVRVSDALVLGDVSQGDRFYNVVANPVTIRRPPPDLNDDGQVNGLDLFEFTKAWQNTVETP